MRDTTFKSFVFIQGKSTSGVLSIRSSAVTLGFGQRIDRIFIWSFHFENYFILSKGPLWDTRWPHG